MVVTATIVLFVWNRERLFTQAVQSRSLCKETFYLQIGDGRV